MHGAIAGGHHTHWCRIHFRAADGGDMHGVHPYESLYSICCHTGCGNAMMQVYCFVAAQ